MAIGLSNLIFLLGASYFLSPACCQLQGNSTSTTPQPTTSTPTDSTSITPQSTTSLTPTFSTSTTPQSTTSTPTDSTSTTPQSTTSIPIGVRGLIGICSIVFILLIYCCFTFAVAMRELSRMKKRRKKKAKYTIVDELDDFDDDEEIDEKNVDQLQSNDLLLTNEHAALVAMKNEVASESEAVASSRPTAVVTEARPSISITSKEESKTEKGQDRESSKPAAVYTTKPRKKVEFVIELPLLNS